jgi:hypothetical protein
MLRGRGPLLRQEAEDRRKLILAMIDDGLPGRGWTWSVAGGGGSGSRVEEETDAYRPRLLFPEGPEMAKQRVDPPER